MRNRLFATIFLIGFYGILHADPIENQPINFGGGLNIKTVPSQIDDNQSPDMNNMTSNQLGASFNRNGSKRYITQAISTNPITGLYRISVSTANSPRKAVIATTWDGIYISTTEDVQNWIKFSSGSKNNQHYGFAAINNNVIIAPQDSTETLKQFSVLNSSLSQLITYDASSSAILMTGKYPLTSQNYLLVANCADLSAGTTQYPTRVYYSLVLQPSSMTALRYLDVATNEGEEITGIWEQNGRVEIAFPSSIQELSFSVLNLTTLGGDQIITPIVQGFGVVAPRSIATDGSISIFAAKDGIRVWDGGHHSRLTISEEARVISTDIEPLIKELIRANTYRNIVGQFYPSKRWYVMAYEDPKRFPRGHNNSILVYDFNVGQWFPFHNWNADSFTVMDGVQDNGQLLYGDSIDGYVYYADQESNLNDARLEIPIDTMDSTSTWQRGTSDFTSVKTGSGAIKMNLSASVILSSITYMNVINLGNWPDKTPVSKSDKFSFKVFCSSIQNISSIRMDLEANTVSSDFDAYFTSVTLSSAALTGGNNAWSTIELNLSSFTIPSEWVSISTEALPFASNLTFYGIRFVVQGNAGNASTTFDDLRLVGAGETALNSYRKTKQFSFGTLADKRFRQLILDCELPQDSNMNIDIFSNFGKDSKRTSIPKEVEKQLLLTGYGNSENITLLNSVDFSVLQTTYSGSKAYASYGAICANKTHLFAADQYNNRIVKIDISSITNTVFVSTYGSFGSGTTNFNNIYQMSVDGESGNLYICDFGNNRLKVHSQDTLQFINSFGTLGHSATSYHNPTGVFVDKNNIFIGQDGNSAIQKLTKSTGGFESSVMVNENINGEITLTGDESFLYDSFVSVYNVNLRQQIILLEKRNKSDLSIVSQVLIYPQAGVRDSTYTLTGDITSRGDFVYIPFTDDANRNGSYYIQKRLKSDLSTIVKEYKTSSLQYSIAAPGFDYSPKRINVAKNLEMDGQYIQLKYSENSLDNPLKLYSQTILTLPATVRER